MKIVRESINLTEVCKLKVDECSSFGGCCCRSGGSDEFTGG
jgi:hypothetical protein